MRYFIAIIGLAASIVFHLPATAENTGSSRFSSRLTEHLNGISGHIYNDHFDRAGILIDSLQGDSATNSFCHFFRVVLYQSQMMAAESDFLREDFFESIDSLESGSKALLSNGQDSALAYFFLGHAHAFRSLYNGRSGSIFKALKSGLAARKAYDRGYKIDSTFHDLALGLGSYRYWKSVKTKAINWTPLFKNEKDDGIKLLRVAAESSEISRDAALVSLIWVYINEKRFAEAIRLASEMRGRYPDGLTFLWALGEAYYKMKDCRSAIDIYETILERLYGEPGNYYNIVEASYYLSKCYRELAELRPDISQRLSQLRKNIESDPIPEKIRKRQKKKIKSILK